MKGRPRKFDIDKALDSAMLVFWRNGYEGASISELSAAMKINRPSLYGTFGDKEQLFVRALERYLADYGTKGVAQLLEHPNITDAIAAFFNCVVEQLTNSQLPSGCLITNCTVECGERFAEIGRRLNQCHAETEAALYNRLKLAQTQRQISEAEDIRALAQFFTATMLGMAVMARNNSNPVVIQQLAKTAMRILPSNSD